MELSHTLGHGVVALKKHEIPKFSAAEKCVHCWKKNYLPIQNEYIA